ncbi:TPA: hypothetical protein R8Q87_000032 [Campylobacter coli]|nr:hypothetical protein [Campylobacter coli]HEF1256231.1 hypothetical protein [Campylobacter coli]HEH4747089.1 hypothetical protein [Campylobacter coli]
MVFLIPLLVIVAVIFGIDYLYFNDENAKVKEEQKIHKTELNLDKQREEYLKHLFKEKK